MGNRPIRNHCQNLEQTGRSGSAGCHGRLYGGWRHPDPEGAARRFHEEYEVVLKDHAHRLTWGMDAAVAWHYTDRALDAWVDAGRALLGMLPAEHARNIGYRTAEDLFDVEVTVGA